MYEVNTKVSNCNSACKGFQLQKGIKKLSIAIEYVNSNSELRFMNYDTCNNAQMKYPFQSYITGAYKCKKS